MSLEMELKKTVGERLKLNEPLNRHTNFRIGGPADFYVEVQNREEAIAVLRLLTTGKIPFFILGGGSNILVSDSGWRGAVVQMAMRNYKIEGDKVSAEAGVPSALLGRVTAEKGLAGLEWAVGLPGTIGGAIRGNAGCWGGEVKDTIRSVQVLSPEQPFSNSRELEKGSWMVTEMNKNDCRFGYRDSIFKRLPPTLIVLSAVFELKRGEAPALKNRLEEIIAGRKEKQPLTSSSAGCIFKNFALSGKEDLRLLRRDADIPAEFMERRRIPAGWLIEQAGLKGLRIGDAGISEKHGNFFLNLGQATADQVIQLISMVKSRVRQQYGLELEEEVQYVGF